MIVIIFILLALKKYEITYIVMLFPAIKHMMMKKQIIIKKNITIYISIIVIVGIFIGLYNENQNYNILKDIYYFTYPILGIIVGYFIEDRNKKGSFYRSIIYIGFVIAIIHISNIILNYNIYSLRELRILYGTESSLELLALLILIFDKKNKLDIHTYKKNVIRNFILISCIFYFSRVMMSFLILILIFNEYSKKKAIVTILVLLNLIVVLNVFSTNKVIDSFLLKAKNSVNEIWEKDFSTEEKINQNWRSYESYIVNEKLKNEKCEIFGAGFGATVKTNTNYGLGKKFVELPIIHNGFSFIKMKVGYFGIMIYLIFLFKLAFMYKKNRFNMIIILHIVITSFVTGGIFSPQQIPFLILIGQQHYKNNYKKKEKQNETYCNYNTKL